MKNQYKIPALLLLCIFCFSCGKEGNQEAKVDTLAAAVDTVQIAAPSPEQLAEEKKQSLLNSSNSKMNEIGDWLNQFEELRSNSINNNEDGSKGPEESETITTTLYKNGIQFKETTIYEGQAFELFVPLLSAKEAKKLLNRLCKNMGGCLGPDEVNVKYTEAKDGVKVEWGGGC